MRRQVIPPNSSTTQYRDERDSRIQSNPTITKDTNNISFSGNHHYVQEGPGSSGKISSPMNQFRHPSQQQHFHYDQTKWSLDEQFQSSLSFQDFGSY